MRARLYTLHDGCMGAVRETSAKLTGSDSTAGFAFFLTVPHRQRFGTAMAG